MASSGLAAEGRLHHRTSTRPRGAGATPREVCVWHASCWRGLMTVPSAGVVARRMAGHDWLLLGYLATMTALTLPRLDESRLAAGLATATLFAFTLVLLPIRVLGTRSMLAAAVYRLSLVLVPLLAYLELRWILPVIAPSPERAQGETYFRASIRRSPSTSRSSASAIVGSSPFASRGRWSASSRRRSCSPRCTSAGTTSSMSSAASPSRSSRCARARSPFDVSSCDVGVSELAPSFRPPWRSAPALAVHVTGTPLRTTGSGDAVNGGTLRRSCTRAQPASSPEALPSRRWRRQLLEGSWR